MNPPVFYQKQYDRLNQIHLNYGWGLGSGTGNGHNTFYTVDDLYMYWATYNPDHDYVIRKIMPSPVISPSSRYVLRNAGSTTFNLYNPGPGSIDWDASDNAGWVTLSPTSGTLSSGQNQTLTVTYTENTSPSKRTANIWVSNVNNNVTLIFF